MSKSPFAPLRDYFTDEKPTPPVVVPRGPLPAFHQDSADPDSGAHLPVVTSFNGPLPALDDQRYHRANLWGMTLPGLPFINGGAGGPAQERMLTYLFDRYPREWQEKGLRTYGERGYRQWWLSPPDAMKGPSQQSISQYCDDTKRVIDAGLKPCHLIRSKDYDGRDPNMYDIYPLLDALSQFGGIDKIAHAWEASLFYDPAFYRQTFEQDATRYPHVEWCHHLQQGYPAFGIDGPREEEALRKKEFWEASIAVGIKRLLYQYDSSWSAGMMQARGNDVSVRLIAGGAWGLSQTIAWDVFEIVATRQFHNQHDADNPSRLVDEDLGDLFGYEMLCTYGPLAPSGFGGGARLPGGSAL